MKKNLRTLALSLIASAAAFQASAYTVDDIVNANTPGEDYCHAIDVQGTPRFYTGGAYRTTWYASGGEVKISAVPGYTNRLRFEGLIKGNISMNFTLSGNTLKATNSPYKQYTNDVAPISGGKPAYAGKVFMVDEVYFSNGSHYYTEDYWTGTIYDEGDHYEIVFNPFKFYLSNTTNMNYASTSFFDGFIVLIPKYNDNTIVKDRLNSVDREYPAYVEIDWNKSSNNFYMENFACSGMAIHTTNNGSYNTGTATGVTGTIKFTDATSGTISLPQQQIQTQVVQGTGTLTHYMVQLCPANATRLGSPVTGTFTVQNYNHRDADRWHKNSGGNLVTERLLNVELDDYKMMTSDASTVVLNPWYNTKMEIADEYTADPTFGTYTVTTSEGWLHFNVNIAEKNEAHVGDYDLYIVPGTKSTIAGDNEFLHTNHGHARAININQLGEVPATAAAAASANGVVNVTRVVAPEDFKDFGWSDDEISEARKGNFSMYIRARYNNSNLEHTYHNLTPVSNTVTGIEEIAASSSLAARGGNGIITVEGTSSLIEVYNLSGVCVYSGYNTEIEVNPGLYIVRADNQTVKVSVR